MPSARDTALSDPKDLVFRTGEANSVVLRLSPTELLAVLGSDCVLLPLLPNTPSAFPLPQSASQTQQPVDGQEPKFLMDSMLSKLVRWMRVLGTDAELWDQVTGRYVA
jgi:hypothetical protein